MKKYYPYKATFILLLLILLHSFVYGQWQYVGSPDSGYCRNISGNADSLFVSSTAGLFFSGDKGLNWTVLDLPDTVAYIREARYTNGTIYLAATEFQHFPGRSNIYRLKNMGETWKDINPISSHTNRYRSYTVVGDTVVILYEKSIAISTDQGETFAIHTDDAPLGFAFPVFLNKHLFVTKDSLVLRSDNYGISWDTVFTMPEGYSPSVFKAIDNTLWFFQATFFGSRVDIYRSENGGDIWEFASEYFQPFEKHALLAGANDNLFIYHIGSTGILNSVDTGKTWQTINQSDYFHHIFLFEDVIVGYDATNIYRSEDFGLSFTTSDSGFHGIETKAIAVTNESVFIATATHGFGKGKTEINWSDRGFFRNVITIGETLFAQHYDEEIVYSHDNGETWLTFSAEELEGVEETSFSQIFGVGNRLYASGGFGDNWFSNNLGHTWHKIIDVDLGNGTFQLMSYGDGKYVALVDYHEVFLSNDGIDWTRITYDFPVDTSFIFPDASFVHRAFGNSFVFNNQTFQRLPDGTTHWVEVRHPIPASNEVPQEHTIEFLESYGDYLIIGVFGYGIFISNDLGETWEEVNEGLSDFHFTSATLHKQDLYIGVLGGVWKRSLKDLGVTSLDSDAQSMQSQINLAPNPVTDQLNISFSSDIDENILIEIIDAKGSVYYSAERVGGIANPISTNTLSAGTYFVRITTISGVDVVSFIKI